MTPEQLRCLALAEQAIGLSDPNPRVGCVIQTAQGQTVEGHTQQAGGWHAEAHALALARQQGFDTRGARVWVSLEPCSHHGRTPPCSQALIDSGVMSVQVACLDPNPRVRGRGVEQLRNAGISVQVDDGAWAARARELNIGFMSRMERGRPWVRMKTAASLDGVTALLNGQSQWITSQTAQVDGHGWRRRASAVLTGIGTIRDDDPRLDVRWVPTRRQPLRVVVDSTLAISRSARILQPPGDCLVYTTNPDTDARAALQRLPGVDVALLPSLGPAGKNDLGAMMTDLAIREVNEVHVEAGEKLCGSLLRAGLVDELLVYMAPKLLGSGKGLASIFSAPLESLQEHIPLEFLDCGRVGPDLRLRALTAGGQAFWTAAPQR